ALLLASLDGPTARAAEPRRPLGNGMVAEPGAARRCEKRVAATQRSALARLARLHARCAERSARDPSETDCAASLEVAAERLRSGLGAAIRSACPDEIVGAISFGADCRGAADAAELA